MNAPAADPSDALLAELQAAGALEAAPPADEVAASTLAMRRRVIGQAAGGWQSAKDGVRHLRYTHEDCVDRIIMCPEISQGELAQAYGVTEAWMSIVMNCDAFKVRLAARREELLDPVLLATVNEKWAAIANRSAEVLLERLHRPSAEMSDKFVLEAAALGARSVGLGQPVPPSGPSANDHLAAIAHRLLDLNKPAAVLDVAARPLD